MLLSLIMRDLEALSPAGKTSAFNSRGKSRRVFLDYRNKPGMILVVTDGDLRRSHLALSATSSRNGRPG